MKKVITGALLLFCCYAQTQKEQSMNQTKCVEIVVFRPQEEVNNEVLMKAMKATNEIVKTFDGFISRTTSMNEQGEFLDVVFWESKEKALSAAQKVQEIPEVMKNFALIDPKSIKMQHYEVFAIQE